uniref:Uncharacterized protein n=1 Tax=Zea mays TaxID=4577 RepID=A0A804QAH7_MAIZE
MHFDNQAMLPHSRLVEGGCSPAISGCSPRQWRRMTCAGSEWWWCTSAAMSLTLMAFEALTTLSSMGAAGPA